MKTNKPGVSKQKEWLSWAWVLGEGVVGEILCQLASTSSLLPALASFRIISKTEIFCKYLSQEKHLSQTGMSSLKIAVEL